MICICTVFNEYVISSLQRVRIIPYDIHKLTFPWGSCIGGGGGPSLLCGGGGGWDVGGGGGGAEGGFIGGVRVGAGLCGLGINWVPEIAGRGWGPRL